MAVIPFVGQQVGGPGAPDLAVPRPNQAFQQLGQAGAQAEAVFEDLRIGEAVTAGAKALSQFRVARAERQIKLREETQDPAGFADRSAADFDEASAQLLSSQKDEIVQNYLKNRLEGLKVQEVAEAVNWEAETRYARIGTQIDAATTTNANAVYSKPTSFDAIWDETEATIKASGLPASVIDKRLAAAKATLGRSAVYGMVEANPVNGLKQLQSGAWDSIVDEGVKISAVNAAQAEIKRRESEAKANANMARQEALFDIQNWAAANAQSLAETGKAVDPPYSEDQLKALLKPKQFETIQHQFALNARLFEATGDMRSQTPAEMLATVEKLKPMGGEADYNDRKSIYDAAVKNRQAILKARADDPGAAARDAFTNVRNRWQFYEKNPQPAHLRDAMKASLAAQEVMGIAPGARRAMPAGLASSIAGDIRDASPTDAANKLSEWRSSFGPYWKQAFSELAPKLDSSSAVAATMDNKNMAAILLETSRLGASAEKGGVGIDQLRTSLGVSARGDNSITDILAGDTDMANLSRSLSFRAGGGKTAQSVYDAAEKLALGLMRRNGVSKEEAADQAIKELVTSKYSFGDVNSIPFAAPAGVDVDAVSSGAREAQAQLTGDGLDLPGPGAPGQLPEAVRKDYLSAVRRNGYWVTTSDERGLELWAGDAPVTRNGKRITRTWDDLAGLRNRSPLFQGGRYGFERLPVSQ